jgi:peptidoglycan/xylan/chitin deacetylase (PgdA/CDA1 family)
MNPISVAVEGKGPFNFLRRGASIARRYGLTPARMSRVIAEFAHLLRRFGCGATFPITAAALQRTSHIVKEYQGQDIEFAIHGYRHQDHSQLSQDEQLAQFELALRVFAQAGLQPRGFRSPYLRWNRDTLVALRRQGLAYDSSQAIAWDVLDGHESHAYLHVLDFYRAVSANDYPSLPDSDGGLVCMPYSLPDDEALVERLNLTTSAQMSALWRAVLNRTYELGELFVLGLHPERFAICRQPLEAVLIEARQFTPAVWIARLDQIAAWWQARSAASVETTDAADGTIRLAVDGPSGTTVLARAVDVDAGAVSWGHGYQQVRMAPTAAVDDIRGATEFALRASLRPFIGLSPVTSPDLAGFLRQQGYIVETSEEGHLYSYYFDQSEFTASQKRVLLSQIEETDRPLLRLGRWPNGARSALAITGDIDALTLWDYGLRFLGR